MASPKPAPRYLQIAHGLRAAIARGEYCVGAKLPSEHQLRAIHAISRHTAREALRVLTAEGLIERRRGAGAFVAKRGAPRFRSRNLGDLADLLQYATDVRLEVRAHARPSPPSLEPAALGLQSDVAWSRIDGLRRGERERLPVALSRIYVRAEVCPSRDELEAWVGPVNQLIAERFGIVTTRIDQEISAATLSRVEARVLEAEAGAPALKITRFYYDQHDRIYEASIGVHPGDRFVYAMTLTGERG